MLWLLIVIGFPLALSLRPPPKSVRLSQTIDQPGHGLAAFTDYLTLSGKTLSVGDLSQKKLVVIDPQTYKVTATGNGLAEVHGFAADAYRIHLSETGRHK